MRIVFSRKGFDAQAGGCPSPLFPDGRALSLPIPDRHAPTCYEKVRWRGQSIAPIVAQLAGGRPPSDHCCHLDPDIDADSLERPAGWRPAYGQQGPAQGHLAKQRVGPGDLFLFFGWFRPVERHRGAAWRYVAGARGVHRLFGWLQVSEVLRVGNDPAATLLEHPWLSGHPHVHGASGRTNNTIYVGAESLDIEGLRDRCGAGLFHGQSPWLTLTAPDSNQRSLWRLPAWMWPDGHPPRLSFHTSESRWQRDGEWARVRTVGRGQDFVLDADGLPEAIGWLQKVFG